MPIPQVIIIMYQKYQKPEFNQFILILLIIGIFLRMIRIFPHVKEPMTNGYFHVGTLSQEYQGILEDKAYSWVKVSGY